MNRCLKVLGKLSAVVVLGMFFIGCGEDDGTTEKHISGFYYPFEGTDSTIIDNSGNNYNGSPSSLSRVPGKVGNAVQFLGQGSAINLEYIYTYFPFTTGLTFKAWIKIDQSVTTRQQIIGSSINQLSNFGISLVNDAISFEVPSGQNVLSLTTNSLSFPLDEWFHVAVTYDGNIVSFYYNGNLVGTDSILTTDDSMFYNRIGNNHVNLSPTDQFLGSIDELYLENKVLSESDISAYYASTL